VVPTPKEDRNLGLLQAVQAAKAAYEATYDDLLSRLGDDWGLLAVFCGSRLGKARHRQRPTEADLLESRSSLVHEIELLLDLRDRLVAAQLAYNQRDKSED
jgi:hypothetical protein